MTLVTTENWEKARRQTRRRRNDAWMELPFFVDMILLLTLTGAIDGIIIVRLPTVKGIRHAAGVIWGEAGMLYSALGEEVEKVRWGGRYLALAVAASAWRPLHPCTPEAQRADGPRSRILLPRTSSPSEAHRMSISPTSKSPPREHSLAGATVAKLTASTEEYEAFESPTILSGGRRARAVRTLTTTISIAARTLAIPTRGAALGSRGRATTGALVSLPTGEGSRGRRAQTLAVTTLSTLTLQPSPPLDVGDGGFAGRRPAPSSLGSRPAAVRILLRLQARARARSARSSNSTGPRLLGSALPSARRDLHRRHRLGQQADAALSVASA